MCWNIEVSFAGVAVGWATCVFLKIRQRPRDDYYARYLVTFTFTQLVDIALWWLHDTTGAYGETVGGLQACQGLQLQFGAFPGYNDPQFLNFMISKFVLPLVVFYQHSMQCTYPSNMINGPGQRKRLILLHLIPVAVMSLAFACTWLVPSPYNHSYAPVEKAPKYTAYDGSMTLHWGGDFTHSQMLSYIAPFANPFGLLWAFPEAATLTIIQVAAVAHSGLVAYVFTLVMPPYMALVHNLVLACVVGTLAATEGTIQLGSKWCTYCLIYSVVYILEPLWYKEDAPDGIPPTSPVKAATSPKSPTMPTSLQSPILSVSSRYPGTGQQLRQRVALPS